MEAVRVFNNELSSLYDVRPPISKAKMTQITKCAIKGIKFYKHIVQSVEKFIQKCRPEYKVPGLYVVDSIVRQSRHQFGSDKDVFAPRFTKNIMQTFQNLFKCAEEERPRIVRVLNLWQKNSVFPSDVIQPLLDMANPNSSGDWSLEVPRVSACESPVHKSFQQSVPSESVLSQNSKNKSHELSSWKSWSHSNQPSEEPISDSHSYMEMSTGNLEKFTKGDSSSLQNRNDTLPHIPEVNSQLHASKNLEMKTSEENAVKFNKKLLDFDYGDEDDDEEMKHDDNQLSNEPNALALSMAQNLLSNPELLRQLQQMQQTIQQNEALKSSMQGHEDNLVSEGNGDQYSPPVQDSPSPTLPPLPFPEPHAQNVLQYQYDNSSMPFPPQQPALPVMDPQPLEPVFPPSVLSQEQLLLSSGPIDEDERIMYSRPGEPPLPPHDLDERSLTLPTEDRLKKERSRSRSGSHSRTRAGRHRSRSKSPRRRKSRSRSRSRSHRNRSRSRDRDRERERIREKERERERERERDRKRKGIPPIKKNYMTVCSTTLWLGHVPKTIAETDLSSTFGEFGTVSSIDMIPPRGCAYVCMDRRQHAFRALQKLKNFKLQGSSVKMAWAPGKGVKGKEYKDYWEVELGVSYVPFEKLPDDIEELNLIEEGGFIDEDSMPEHLRDLRQRHEKLIAEAMDPSKPKIGEEEEMLVRKSVMQASNSVPPAMMPPTSLGIPMVLPQLMQPQFSMHLPGLMPPHQTVVMPVPMGVPPPNPLMVVQPPSQTILGGQPLPVVGSVSQLPHMSVNMQTAPVSCVNSTSDAVINSPALTTTVALSSAGDATPTEEDGTSVSTPGPSLAAVISATASISTVSSQFNPLISIPSGTRPMLSVPPPVSSTGAPIPFPPPHVTFGFPPPPIRPPSQGQALPGVCSLPNSSFPWLPKSSAPAFMPTPDSDMRFTSPASNATANVHHVPLPNVPQSGQPHPVYGVRLPFPEVTSDQTASSNVPSHPSELQNKSHLPVNRSNDDAMHLEREGSANVYGIPHNTDVNLHGSRSKHHGKGFFHHEPPAPRSFQDKGNVEMNLEEQEESSHEQYPSANVEFLHEDHAMMPPNARFPGPDFHLVRGPLNSPWMRGPPPGVPGPRYPRGVHPGAPFPHRVGAPRGPPPRMEMDFHRPPGPRGPRMHLVGPHSHPSRRGGALLQTPPRHPGGREWFSGRRDFHEQPFDRDRERRFRPKDDWSHRRENWDERSDWCPREEWDEQGTDRGHRKHDDKIGDSPDRHRENSEVKPSDKNPDDERESKAPHPPEKYISDQKDWSDDMLRLQCYTRDKDNKPRPLRNSSSNRSKDRDNWESNDSHLSNDAIEPEKSERSGKYERIGKPFDKSEHNYKKRDRDQGTLDPEEVSERNRGRSEGEKETRERKRSRWGRTLSQEREFQQQMINEIEMKFQNYELLNQVQSEQDSANGNSVSEKTEDHTSIPEVPVSVENNFNSSTSVSIKDAAEDSDALANSGETNEITEKICSVSNSMDIITSEEMTTNQSSEPCDSETTVPISNEA